MATCPECDAEIEIDEDDMEEMELGDPWDCDSCATRLRVISLDPLDFETDEEDEDDDEEKKTGDDTEEADVDEDDDDDDEKEDWDE